MNAIKNHPSDVQRSSFLVHRFLLALCIASSAQAAEGPPAELAAARALLLSGKYAEAEEAYSKVPPSHSSQALVGIARTLTARGKPDEAEQLLSVDLSDRSNAAPIHAELAQLSFDRGDYERAARHVAAAISFDSKNRLARWIQAELHRTAGRLAEADAAYQWFVHDYNETDEFDDPDDLRLIGLAAAQYARWNRISDQFNFFVNDLYPSALELDKQYWPANYETGRLFLEKYNEAEAARDLKAALALNPQSAEIHTALAELALQNYNLDAAKRSIERALELRPGYVPALRAQADALLANFAADEAIDVLEAARKLNPVDEQTLGRLAAAYAVVDGWSDAHVQSARFKKIIDDVNSRNPHAGEFYFALAQAFDQTRRFPAAAQYYREARVKMPQLTTPAGELGMMLMRLGDEVEARKLLDESFKIDPFNVRVSNLRKVLDVLSEYAVLETPHFVVKYDRIQDEILAKYAAEYLEDQVYPELTTKFGFEPEGKSLFEIFNRSRNTDGHGWFSARMVGLPYVGTVGACAGKMVAIASPNSMPEKFNWARVLKHEFVHVLNLQQSRFNIPHWYTEALAVESEGYPRSDVWNKLLAERVPKNDLFNLDTINLGFVRPKSSLDWQMAYCQAQLYAQYMLKTYGDDALAKMLACYRDNLNTKDALRRSFDVAQADFERGYLDFVRNIAKDLSSSAEDDEMSFADLVRKVKELPDDADVKARLARAYLAREEYPQAREHADAALKIDAKHQLATLVRVRLHLVIGDDRDAEKQLSDCLDRDEPNSEVLALLASLVFAAGRHDEAEKLYALGREKFPHDPKWAKALAKIYLVTKNEPKLAASLEALALADADDGVVRRKLAQMAAERGDFQEARRWATDAVHCDVLDPTAHRLLAAALVELKRPAEAMREYETLVKLEPDDAEAWAGLVRTARDAGKDEVAAKAAERLKQLDPKHEVLKKND